MKEIPLGGKQGWFTGEKLPKHGVFAEGRCSLPLQHSLAAGDMCLAGDMCDHVCMCVQEGGVGTKLCL